MTEPQAAPDPSQPPPKKRKLHTYHCLCTSHLLCTTFSISKLDRRKGKDRALILPHLVTSSAPSSNEQWMGRTPSGGYVFLNGESIRSAQNAKIIRTEDGFEKRWSLVCERCDLVIGYQLGWGQWGDYENRGEDVDMDSHQRSARREHVSYILPGSLVSTDEMEHGKKPRAKELDFGLGIA